MAILRPNYLALIMGRGRIPTECSAEKVPPACSPVRRKAKSTPCILPKKDNMKIATEGLFLQGFLLQDSTAQEEKLSWEMDQVVTVSDYHLPGTEELLSHQGDLIQVFCKDEEGQGFSHVQNRQQGFFPSPNKCSARHIGNSKQRSFCYSSTLANAKTLQSHGSPISHHNAKWIASTEPAMRDGVFEDKHRRSLQKNIEDDPSTIQGTEEASLPLTGSILHGTPSLLRKIWMKHKKKSEYLGATNSAFEAD